MREGVKQIEKYRERGGETDMEREVEKDMDRERWRNIYMRERGGEI